MKMGTKSLLFGAHQILWHPYDGDNCVRQVCG